MKKTIKIIVTHNHQLLREMLSRILASQPDFWVIAKTKNFLEAKKTAAARRADIILTAGSLMSPATGEPPTVGLAVVKVERFKNVTKYSESRRLSYNAPLKDLYAALRSAADRQKPEANLKSQITQFTSLTPREREIFTLLAQGLSNQQIGQRLYITERTVKYHVSNVLRKINAASRTEAAVKFMRAVG